MSTIYVRPESSSNNFFTRPFEVGVRHLKLALCDGDQKTLINLAKERIIYRPSEDTNSYKPLTLATRAYHITIGVLETLGYLTIIIPFIVAIADRLFSHPPYQFDKARGINIHQIEGGHRDTFWTKNNRRTNPFETKQIDHSLMHHTDEA